MTSLLTVVPRSPVEGKAIGTVIGGSASVTAINYVLFGSTDSRW